MTSLSISGARQSSANVQQQRSSCDVTIVSMARVPGAAALRTTRFRSYSMRFSSSEVFMALPNPRQREAVELKGSRPRSFPERETLKYSGRRNQAKLQSFVAKHFENLPEPHCLCLTFQTRKHRKGAIAKCRFQCTKHWNRETQATCSWQGTATLLPPSGKVKNLHSAAAIRSARRACAARVQEVWHVKFSATSNSCQVAEQKNF